ncbi:hypothetical protein SUGI_0300510 [Cryptomeria japonica]|uniref:protein LEAD-SENSITIVE 1-like n=1 Tax=Cryptomeria japonica TaxID=3369 RepID=UPI002408E959|nr:protein LEAD-SENSITIVE 1-like [Cryptomeria japonica]GLJ17308.1 hypothetical protein SUGI_0300510 [Cryptomeria japonica]
MGNVPAGPSKPINVVLSRSEILPGDHIYTSRGAYDHHGIYIGENRVIHFQNSVEGTSFASSTHPFGPCSVCGYHSGMSGVVLTCLDCFLHAGNICRYEYGVKPGLSTFLPASPERKWCTAVSCDPPEIVIRRARDLLKDGFGTYNLLWNNCEHFAIFCKTGQYMPLQGGQVNWTLDMLQPFISFPAAVFVLGGNRN